MNMTFEQVHFLLPDGIWLWEKVSNTRAITVFGRNVKPILIPKDWDVNLRS